MDSPFKPTQIGAYDVISVIGRDAISTVFKAMDRRANRSVAIKVLTAPTDQPDLLLLKFYRQAKDTPKLEQQNIATVYELGYENGLPYLVMEYLEGESLDAVIAARHPMLIAEKLRIIAQVCAGLSYAHKQDLLHRDIKPASIVIVENNTAKIVDFGMARLCGNQTTETGQIGGNLNYLSPEQLNGNVELDVRTDVYSAGVVLFQLLTGTLPFEDAAAAAILRKIEQDPPPPLGRYLKDCPEELEAITRKALARNREDRYPSAEDFGADVAHLQQKYEKQMLVDYLQSAKEFVARKDFANAKQQVLDVLRLAPQNVEADNLLRLIKQGQEQQQREQQVSQLRAKAEGAFRRNEFADAIQFVEQGLQLDSGAAVLLRLRDAILAAREKMAKYLEAFERAESALQVGDLENAKQSIDRATAIQPEDPQGRRLASQIRFRIEQQTRERQAAERKKRLDSDIAIVETAMADARLLLASDQTSDALQRLEGIEGQVSQLPPKWGEEVEWLKKEVLAQHERSIQQSAPPPLEFSRIDQDLTNRGEGADGKPAFESSSTPSPNVTPLYRNPFDEPDDLHPLRNQDLDLVQDGSESVGPQAESLRFEDRFEKSLEPPKVPGAIGQTWRRSIIWLGLAVLVLVAVVLWFVVRPKNARVPVNPPLPIQTAKYTYAEINAEPWATLRAIDPGGEETQNALGSTTPLRIKLPPGQYSIVLEGPNHERAQRSITVPQQGGTSCFVLFKRPDLNRLLSHP